MPQQQSRNQRWVSRFEAASVLNVSLDELDKMRAENIVRSRIRDGRKPEFELNSIRALAMALANPREQTKPYF